MRSAAPSPRAIAAFDFDGTLTRRDSVVPFLVEACGPARVSSALGRALLAEATRRPPSRDRVKERLAAELLAGRDAAELAELGRSFAARILAKGLRPETPGLLARHREAGDLVVVVSASFSFYLRPAAEALGAHAALCTEVELDAAGRCTGRLAGGNCRGEEKVRRLRDWAGSQGLDLGASRISAYGDSSGDLQMLRLADQAVWVGRKARRLEARASRKDR